MRLTGYVSMLKIPALPNPTFSRETQTRFLIGVALSLIIIVAWWLRYIFLILNGGLDPNQLRWADLYWFGGIMSSYLEGALRIAKWATYAQTQRPPGYSAFLALWQLLGIHNWQHVRFAQIAFDSAACIPAYLIARWAKAGRGLALIAALGYAVLPIWASGSGLLMAEALSPSLMLWFVWLLTRADSNRHVCVWAGVGLLAGAMAMVRFDMLLLVAPAVLWALWRVPRRRILTTGTVLLMFFVVIGSWGLHNKEVHGQWMFSGSDGGYTLWAGLGDIPNPYGYYADDARAIALVHSLGMKWNSVPSDRYFMHQYLRAWRDHPGYVLEVAGYRFRQIVFPPVLFGPNTSNTYQADGVGWAQWFLFHFGLYALLLYVILNRRRLHECFLIALPLLYALGSIGLVHWEERYITYAYITYVLATVLLAQQLARSRVLRRTLELDTSTSKRRLLNPGIYASAAVIVTALCALGLAPTSQAAMRIKYLDTQIAEGKATQLQLQDLHFTQDVANSVAHEPNGSLRIITNRSKQDYQVTAKIPLWGASAAKINITLTVAKGGATIGLLTPDGSKWITQTTNVGEGTYQNTLFILRPYTALPLVIANLQPGEAGQSVITVDRLDIYLAGANPPQRPAGPTNPRDK